MADLRALPVPEGLAGERVDAALSRLLGFSRTRAAELAQSGAVLLDGRVLGKSDRLVAGAWLEITMPEPVAPPPEPIIGLAVAYEDEDVVVVDKPVGVAAHPSPGWTGPTVVGALRSAGVRVSDLGPAERQGIVHRLDAGTSGLMAVAKSDLAYTGLKRAFKERTVHKVYHALVQGHMDPLAGTIDAPVGRHPNHDYRFAVVADGKHAITHYETLEAMPGASLLEIDLETGRTHQIRVHTAAMRHPCVGDTTYGADPVLAERLGLTRQWLHAVRLTFDHPRDGQPVVVTSDYPADLADALAAMRG